MPPPLDTSTPYLLSDLPAGHRHLARSKWLIALSSLVFVCVAPFAKVPGPVIWPFIPLLQSALIINDIVTVALLIGQLGGSRSRSLTILAAGYLFSAVMTVMHTISFPGLFQVDEALGADPQSTAWLYCFWHGIFPLFIVAYARLPDKRLTNRELLTGALGALALSAVFTWIGAGLAFPMPVLLGANGYTTAQRVVLTCVWLSSAAAIWALLRKRPRTVMDTWLFMVMIIWLFDIALVALLNGGRFDVGFYAGRLYGLVASTIVLVALLIETGSVYSHLSAAVVEMTTTRERETGRRLLEAVVKQLPEGVLAYDRTGAALVANDRAVKMLQVYGDSVPHLNTDVLPAWLDQAAWQKIQSSIKQLMAGSSFKNHEIRTSSDGCEKILSLSGTAVHDDRQELLASVLVLNDITGMRQDEVRLRNSLMQIRYLVENTPLAVIEWSSDLTVSSWNQRAAALFGWQASELLGERIDRLPILHEDDRQAMADLVRHVTQTNLIHVISSHIHRTKDGRICHTEWYTSILNDESGQLVSAFSLIMDVTEQKQALAALKEADRRKDAYLATLAHELRNPLAPIHHAAALMRAKRLPQERLESIAELIDRQVDQMSRMLEDLLDIARITNGKVKLHMSHVDLKVVINDALDMSRPLLERANHSFTVDCPDGPVIVEADVMRLTQVFTNLINNAAKYTNPGGHIHIDVSENTVQAFVKVCDNGVGIEPAMLGQVFSPFVQVDRALHLSQGGLGIGLALAKGIIELHGGTITVHSDGAGKGAEFKVTLGLAADYHTLPKKRVAQRNLPTALNKTILVADDNVDAAELLASVLRDAGARVEVAYDGVTALDIFNRVHIDIAILDVQMPYLNGIELAMRFARAHPKPYLIALTGWGTEEDRRTTLKSGFDKHLSKPMAPAKMLELVTSLC